MFPSMITAKFTGHLSVFLPVFRNSWSNSGRLFNWLSEFWGGEKWLRMADFSHIASGNLLENDGKWPIYSGKSTIKFNIAIENDPFIVDLPIENGDVP